MCYQGLLAQQHRGQESAGIAVTDGSVLNGHAGMGLVSQVFNPRMLREDLAGMAAIGHVRYSTTGSSKLCNAQPLLREYALGPVAIAHNGNLINATLLRQEYEAHGHIFQSSTDTEIIVHLLAKPSHATKMDPLPHVLKHLQGAFSLLFLFPDRLEAVRDPWGIRPLVLGRTAEGHWCVASETCAFDAIGGKRVVIVEDSVVRGTTTRSKIRAIRQAGAKEIHLRVSCPPIRHPCFYGIDFPTSEELIAHNRTPEQVGEFLEVDSLAYLSLEGMLGCMKKQKSNYCTACWTGQYKIPIDQPQSKFSFER